MTEPHELRISDDDRHRVAELLRTAAGEGRLDVEELDERLEATYAAKVYADLVPIVVDLPGNQLAVPAPAAPATPAVGSAPRHRTSTVIMSGQTVSGVWEVGPKFTACAVMGGVDIDLREAVFAEREVVIYANAVMGGIDIVVNARTNVMVEGIGIMGSFDQGRDRVEAELDQSSPIVRVKGVALMGSVTVTRKRAPGEPKALRKRHWGH